MDKLAKKLFEDNIGPLTEASKEKTFLITLKNGKAKHKSKGTTALKAAQAIPGIKPSEIESVVEIDEEVEKDLKEAKDRTIEVDVISDVSADLLKSAKSLGLKSKLVSKSGPGGGHPIYSFTGPMNKLKKLAIDYDYIEDEDDSLKPYLVDHIEDKGESINESGNISNSEMRKYLLGNKQVDNFLKSYDSLLKFALNDKKIDASHPHYKEFKKVFAQEISKILD